MKLGQSFVRSPTNPAPAAAPTLTRTEGAINKVKRCKQQIINSLSLSQATQAVQVMLLFTHIVWFYTLLLATMLEKKTIHAWVQEFTTWILILNSLFYVTLIYSHYNKNPARNAASKKVLSKFYTLLYTLNVGVAYYFWIKIYPEAEKPVKDRIIYIYTYPAISVVMNIVVQQPHLKKLRFREVGDTVLFLSLYVATCNMLHTASKMVNGSHDTEKQSKTVWIDSVGLRANFFDLIMLIVMGYLQLKLTFKLISVFKMARPARTTQNTNTVSQV